MAAQNGLDFEGEFNNAIDGLFKNNTSRDISPTDQRVLVTSIRESYVNRVDDILDEDAMTTNSSTKIPSQQSVKAYVDGLAVTQEFDRAFDDELLFDKNEIFYATHELTEDVNYTLAGSGHLSGKASGARQRIITNGTFAINFGSGFDFKYGITDGQILEAGNYEIYFLYTNGSVAVNVPGVSQQTSVIVQLLSPSNFSVVADGENALDFTWDDVSNESSYQIERSLTGTGGWTVYSTPAADVVAGTETGLTPGATVYYRLKAVGDGINYSDSPYVYASGTTTNSGDVTAPTFTFNPTNGSAVWALNRPITITASEPLKKDDGSVLGSNVAGIITLKQTNSGGSNIAHSWSIDATKTIITITPTTSFGASQLVYLAIDGVEDATGNESILTAITFTTTDYTWLNGISNRVIWGDILDNVFTPNDTNFRLEVTLKNPNLTGVRDLMTKASDQNVQNCFKIYYANTTVVFAYFMNSDHAYRFIVWENTDMAAGVMAIRVDYDGAVDTNNGLDRVVLRINGVIQTGGFLSDPTGALTGNLTNSTSYLAFGNVINALQVPLETRWYEGEVKDYVIKSNSGATTELNCPVLFSGLDTSGNARHGSWIP